MLNCLAAAIPGGDRIISAEEVFELRFSHPDWVALQTRQVGLEGTGEVSLRDLVRETLRMRPTRIIVGEVRSAESLDLLLALNAGLPGMATLHANSAREALVKLCTLPLLAGENISARFVVPTVASSVDLVVHLGLDAAGVRRVNEIVAVPGRVENDIVETEPVFVRQGRRPGPHRRDAHAAGHLRASRRRRPPPPARGRLMGAVLGLLLGVGLLLVWSSFWAPAPARASATLAPAAAAQQRRARRGEPGRVRWSCACVCAFTRHGRRAGRLADAAGGPGLRRDGRLPARRGAQGSRPPSAARVRRGVARGGRQPRLRRAGRDVPARGALGPVRARTGAAARRRSAASRSTTR